MLVQERMVSFTALDRCDRCMAQAYALAEKENFSDLLFCRHHAVEFEDALLDSGWWVIRDEEAISRLTQTPGGSAW